MSSPEHKSALGKQAFYNTRYNAGLLLALPRADNRQLYNLHNSYIPFIGWDIWHAYEAGFLTDKGLPIAGVLKLAIPCNSLYLVESKSLKLYLNSFNMEPMGDNIENAINAYISTVKNDLSALLKTCVKAAFYQKPKASPYGFEDYPVLEELPEAEKLNFSTFKESPDLLKPSTGSTQTNWCSHLLRSNCKVTHQPDWGSVYFHIKGHRNLVPTSLLQYLVSFRTENHFHEEVCEMIYKRLWDLLQPEELSVTCIYTRRGGIDICPQRASDAALLHRSLISPQSLNKKLIRQ